MFRAVVFDWDGTLAKTKQIVVQSFQKALGEFEFKVTEELILDHLGKSAKEIFTAVLKASKINFNQAIVDDLVKKRVRAELELSSCVELREGVFDLLNALKDKIRIALATMNNKAVIDKMLNGCGLRSFFDVVLSADDVLKPKPDPEIYQTCASKLGLKPAFVVVIEDSVFGVRSAKRANMKCIAVLSGVSLKKELENENPDLVVRSIKDKKKILNYIFYEKK